MLTFIVLIVRFAVITFVETSYPWRHACLDVIIDYVIVCITLIVVAVPEGLPLALVLSLAYSIKVRIGLFILLIRDRHSDLV